MDPIALLRYWKVIAVGLLVIALGVQSYRLKAASGQVAVLKEREAAQLREQEKRELHNSRNKERTDEDYAGALKRASAARVLDQPASIVAHQAPAAASGEGTAACSGGGDVDALVAEFAQRHATRLTLVLADISRRDAERATAIARLGEELAAAYRACHAFAVNIDE